MRGPSWRIALVRVHRGIRDEVHVVNSWQSSRTHPVFNVLFILLASLIIADYEDFFQL